MKKAQSSGLVANRFDVVPVRPNNESRIVICVVMLAQTRRTVVFATHLQCRAIATVDLLVTLGRECQLEMRRLVLGLACAE